MARSEDLVQGLSLFVYVTETGIMARGSGCMSSLFVYMRAGNRCEVLYNV